LTHKERYRSITQQLPLFAQAWWLDIVCDGTWDVAIVGEEQNIQAVWPYSLEKKWGFRIIRNPMLTAYLGPIFLSAYQEDVLSELWSQLPKTDMLQWTCIPEFTATEFFISRAVEHKKKRTFYINLQATEEELWAQIFPKRKNDIRKAQQDLTLKEIQLDVKQFVQWHQRAFNDKNKAYPFSVSFFERIISSAAKHNASLSLAAFDQEDNCLGQIWLCSDQTKMYYLLSATAAETHRGAIALLIWNALLEAKKSGLKIFDFEGSMDEGIANFFQRFGGIEMDYPDFTMTNSPLWKLKKKLLG
jgi:lipid II:glycine glycyltransferase (peptidoglycan interpeptide bridge formation enzyme)